MKCIILLVLLLVATCCAIVNSHFNGRPGCRTAAEIGTAYPNFDDSTHYWRCLAVNVTATSFRCPNGYGFQASQKACLSYTVWRWETPKMPPSCPDFEEECIPDIQVPGNFKKSFYFVE